jgi:hypothetical protein
MNNYFHFNGSFTELGQSRLENLASASPIAMQSSHSSYIMGYTPILATKGHYKGDIISDNPLGALGAVGLVFAVLFGLSRLFGGRGGGDSNSSSDGSYSDGGPD